MLPLRAVRHEMRLLAYHLGLKGEGERRVFYSGLYQGTLGPLIGRFTFSAFGHSANASTMSNGSNISGMIESSPQYPSPVFL